VRYVEDIAVAGLGSDLRDIAVAVSPMHAVLGQAEHWLTRTARTTVYADSSAATSKPQACSEPMPAGIMSTSTLILYVLVAASRSIVGRS
jgi:hypothetical protein